MLRRFDPTVAIFAVMTVGLLALSMVVFFRLEETTIGLLLMAMFVVDVVVLVMLIRTPSSDTARRATVPSEPVAERVPVRQKFVDDLDGELDDDEYPDYLR